jgi:hypothetical protein
MIDLQDRAREEDPSKELLRTYTYAPPNPILCRFQGEEGGQLSFPLAVDAAKIRPETRNKRRMATLYRVVATHP